MSLIVVVDDQGSNQRIYSRLSKLAGDDVSVKTFASPFRMLDWLEEGEPDLIITDYKMPGMDGAQLTRRLRDMPNSADVPIIVLTAYEDLSFRLMALEAGATDFLQTPVNHEEFVSRARNFLKFRRQQQSVKLKAQALERRLLDSEYFRQIAVRDSREQLAQVIDTVPALISATDRDGRCVFVNAMFAVYAGRDPSTCVGLPAETLLAGTDVQRLRQVERSVLTRGLPHPSFEEMIRSPEGSERYFLTTKSPLLDTNSKVVGVLTSSLDISEQKMAHERLRELALHDGLTGLPNRTYLSNRVQALLLEQENEGRMHALHLLDIDRFKTVNDTLGHYVGDQLLQAISHRLKLLADDGITLTRLGGDEFAFLQEGIHDVEDAERLARRVVELLSEPIDVARHRVNATASLGIALIGPHGHDVNEVLKNADLAMYQAKSEGRNRYALFEAGLRARIVESSMLEAAMRDALARGEFVLHYQPQVDIASGRISGVEALIRWQHPQRGLLSPLEFLGVAEETGLIAPISEWVLREACRQAQEWRHMGFDTLTMAVNMAPVQFNYDDIPLMVSRVLQETGLPAANLELELTENTFFDPVLNPSPRLEQLQAMGVRLTLDDFGTGYSSLLRVKMLPIDALKIDRSFLEAVPSSEADAAIVRAIIRLAHGIGLHVVAEGVERADQLEFLRKEGCEFAQGYYLGRPLTAEACLAALTEDLRRVGMMA
ncbi:two-component system response regulator [Aureimonas frigidaquae]|nr:EAL domain-containing protein [Aureimonas frigidaquae]